VPLTYDQFRYAFANAASDDEAKQLYETYAVPASGKSLFQAATANLNPWTEAKVDTKNPDRGPLLLISGELDHTVPWAIVNASYQQQQDNQGVTEIVKIKGRGHALAIDSGWREVADTALAFVKRKTPERVQALLSRGGEVLAETAPGERYSNASDGRFGFAARLAGRSGSPKAPCSWQVTQPFYTVSIPDLRLPRRLSRAKREVLAMIGENAARRAFGGRLATSELRSAGPPR
jgi:hypothetical protein